MLSNLLRRWKMRRPTVSDFAPTYREHLDTLPIKRKTWANRNRYVLFIVEHMGELALVDVRPSHVARMVAAIQASGRRVAARRALFEANAFFYRAVLEGHIQTNPADPVKAPAAPPVRSRLTLDEWKCIHEWALGRGDRNLWFASALKLALVTAQRRSDLVRMRTDHIVSGALRIEQFKTGERIALPLTLRLEALDTTLGDVVQECMDYRRAGVHLLRKTGDAPFDASALSARFAEGRGIALPGADWSPRTPPTFHEIRSLSERLYRAQGIDTMTLLGHRRQSMTDQYNDARGLDSGKWRSLEL
ncbi:MULTISPECIES: tyrosine-type recombinase/integrase [unclassified Halomonas]|uniref:tyrosine-type recombinase/integrase n=1 Tax=unclassified Halomonas TaxID=2609666 RepID=UPI0020A23152|nr:MULTISPECIES: tyrosine-type recombinase/integrase [unclassified Halomonas]MCP1312991.1 tyrosine-type recombinase/integrase [Halomonas sp. 707D7]MCP1326162.1 tyrosine-type recombinase/integrase [Halomonas sp. 707D4]